MYGHYYVKNKGGRVYGCVVMNMDVYTRNEEIIEDHGFVWYRTIDGGDDIGVIIYCDTEENAYERIAMLLKDIV
jgi:hypothetical protein